MFKYRSLILLLLVITACDAPIKVSDDESCEVDTHKHVMHETDSILVLADEGFEKMKQRKMQQDVFVDSLEYTIKQEQHTINDINRELDRRMNVEVDLELTRQELETALGECKKIKRQLEDQADKFMTELEFYTDKEIAVRDFCRREIDSLYEVLKELRDRDIDTIYINKKKRRKKI